MIKLKKIKWVQLLTYVALIAALCYYGFFGLQRNINLMTTQFLESATIAMLLAISLNLVVGYLGELSLGHAGFMFIGAVIGAKFATILTERMPGNETLVLLICMLIGGIAAAICGVIIGLPALRLRGDYLAIVTLAFGEIVRTVFMNMPDEWFGGQQGQSVIRYDRYYLFIICFIVLILSLLLIQNFLNSKHGRAVTAIRDSEIAARATGISVTKYKLLVFTISAFFAGIAGVLFAFSQETKVPPDKFDYNRSIEILVMVVLGGMGSLEGSLLAALLITWIDQLLQVNLTDNVAVFQGLVYALLLILLVVYRNAPGLKGFREKWNIRNLLNKIKKRDPATISNDEAKWDRIPTKIMVDEVLSVDIQTTSPYEPDKAEKEDE